MKDLDERIKLLALMDELKNVKRQIYIKGRRERENDAEHSWHICMWFLILKDILPKNIDSEKILVMLLIHDLPEIYAGDVIFYKKDDKQREKETKAAKKIFKKFPSKLANQYHNLWKEFESGKTKEAKIARSLDKMQPMLQNLITQGKSWKRNGIRIKQVRNIKIGHMDHDDEILKIFEELLKRAKKYID